MASRYTVDMNADRAPETPDDDFDPRETYAAVLEAWDADDENPEQYLDYLREPQTPSD